VQSWGLKRSRGWVGVCVLACACVLGALLACSSSALASRPHEFSGSFGSKCIGEPCTGAQLKKTGGVAVNEASRDIYVVDKSGGAVRQIGTMRSGAAELLGVRFV
jgi:hypothetical protein